MAKQIVTHSDYTDANGVRRNSIGAAFNDSKKAYWDAINLAKSNGDSYLAETLQEYLTQICEIDCKVLEAICELQG